METLRKILRINFPPALHLGRCVQSSRFAAHHIPCWYTACTLSVPHSIERVMWYEGSILRTCNLWGRVTPTCWWKHRGAFVKVQPIDPSNSSSIAGNPCAEVLAEKR